MLFLYILFPIFIQNILNLAQKLNIGILQVLKNKQLLCDEKVDLE